MITRLLPSRGEQRLLALSWLVKTAGSGLYLPASALYFTRIAGFSVGQVALGLTVGGLLALAGSIPLGGLADRFGARRVYLGMLVLQFVVMATLSTARSFPVFLVLIVLFTVTEQGSSAARGALIARRGEGRERVWLRAYLRVVTNIGISIGAGLAALAVVADTDAAYVTLLLVTAATYLGAGVPLLWLADDPPARPESDEVLPRGGALRDLRYVVLTVVCGVLSMQASILSFAVPLWIVDHTDAPRIMVSVVVVVNTAMVVLLQIRFSRNAEEDTHAIRLCRRAGIILLAACVVVATTRDGGGVGVVAALVLFAVLLTLGELWLSAGSFGLSFSLARPDRHGQYQGLFQLGRGAAVAVAPTLIGALCLGSDPEAGWVVLGLLFGITGLVAPLVLRIRPPWTPTRV